MQNPLPKKPTEENSGVSIHANNPDKLNKFLPDYDIISLISEGGMGSVFKAKQKRLNRIVAIKVLPLGYSTHEEFALRFQREAEIMARLDHPNIVKIYDFGTIPNGNLYMVMEFIDGSDLSKIVDREHPVSKILEIGLKTADALQHMHEFGILHRDIKPANILLSPCGEVKLTDFGISKSMYSNKNDPQVTLTGIVMGSYDYMAPEHRIGQEDERSDLYSLGVTLYELFTGSVPCGVYQTICDGERPRIDRLLIQLLERDPNSRPKSAEELRRRLKHLLKNDHNLSEATTCVAESTNRSFLEKLTGAVLLMRQYIRRHI